MPEVVVWGLCWPQPAPNVATDRAGRQLYGSCAVSWWVRGCMETRIPGTAGCCQSVEDVRKQRPAKGYSYESPTFALWRNKTLIDELAVNLRGSARSL